jgi:hypothetical protein
MREFTIDEERLAFYHEFCIALTQFRFVSDSLYRVMEASGGDEEQKTASLREFVTAETFGQQLKATDRLLPKFLAAEVRDEWSSLRTKLSDAKEKRNELAHCWLIVDVNAKVGERVMMLPMSAKKWRGEKKLHERAAFLLDVVRIRYVFFEIAVELENFSWRLMGSPDHLKPMPVTKLDEPDLAIVLRQPYMYLNKTRED